MVLCYGFILRFCKMITFNILSFVVTLALLSCWIPSTEGYQPNRKFDIDFQNDTFTKDGQPFQFASGSFHYFRALPESWRHILRSMRAAGLNTVMTYIEWSLHEPVPGQYRWDGIANLEEFIEIAQSENLYVILRPGPYICAERDMGGFPHWLLTKYSSIKLRTYDTDYLKEVQKWYSQLMPRMARYLYGNGGPVIMVSIENEYGSFHACDRQYMQFLKNLTADNPEAFWKLLRKRLPKGPLVNAEYYPGWLTHWMEPTARVDTGMVVKTLRMMLNQKANVNFYMFFGGTNFGFTAGANDVGPGKYSADITSYDYDAPLDEAGDPTPKYFAIRKALVEVFQGILSRETNIYSLPLSVGLGSKLQLLVESQGRINYNIPNDFKGILGSVTIDSKPLYNWTITCFPLDSYQYMENFLNHQSTDNDDLSDAAAQIYYGTFMLNNDTIYDTYLYPSEWGKGLVFINGFNLGRYWPLAGPQITLYVPRHILTKGSNHIVMIEYQKKVQYPYVQFVDKPIFT
uniref:Uncharacterized protein n=1 Tax=Anopheles atroparvus TaxID=41427 RepID=A0A182IM64_ANOAO